MRDPMFRRLLTVLRIALAALVAGSGAAVVASGGAPGALATPAVPSVLLSDSPRRDAPVGGLRALSVAPAAAPRFVLRPVGSSGVLRLERLGMESASL